MSWALLEKMLADVATHSTLIGKYWFSFLFVFRVITVLSVGDKVYGDEQSRFICNTLQPGCDNVCFNRFSPISHIRFWAMQILLVSLPSVIFIVWAMHSLNKVQLKKDKLEKEMNQVEAATDPMAKDPVMKNSARNRFSDQPPKYNGETEKKSVSHNPKNPKDKKASRRSATATNNLLPMAEIIPVRAVAPKKIKEPPILTGYVLQVIFRMAIEITFIVLQYILFQTQVPEMYRCERYPCPAIVECFISRPMEKTIFMLFMYAIAGTCVLLDIVELKYLGFQKIRHCLGGSKKGGYLDDFEGRWHNDQILGGRFDIVGRGRGLRRHRDMSITDPESGGAYDSIETSDDGSGFE
ncbi:gap junction delta-2 protein-like [Styela clava]